MPTRMTHLHSDSPIIPEALVHKVVEKARELLPIAKIDGLPGTHTTSHKTIPIVHHDEVEVGDVLGQGGFSTVYEIKSICDEPVDNLVLKVLKPELVQRPGNFAACSCDLVRESMILARLRHPNVIALRAYSPGGIDAYINGHCDAYFMVLDRLEETLTDRLCAWRKICRKPPAPSSLSQLVQHCDTKASRMQRTLMERTDILCDLAGAIEYLHSQRIVHRDLKPENLGITSEGCLKVFDLDVCRILPADAVQDTSLTFHFTKGMGSPRYMAPEVARGDAYNAKADVYSFGLLVWEVLTLKTPFAALTPELHDQLVYNGEYRPIRPKKNWSTKVQDLLHRCWSSDIAQRPTMKEITQTLRADLNTLFSRRTYLKYFGKNPMEEGIETHHDSTVSKKWFSLRPRRRQEQQPQHKHENTSDPAVSNE